jgi:DNA-binding NarL/FixJ family response regulator
VLETCEMPARSIDPRAYEVLDRIVAATEAMREHEAARAAKASERARAITEAQGYGMSLAVIAERLNVSRQRVAEMVTREASK